MNKKDTKFWGYALMVIFISAVMMIKFGGGFGTAKVPLIDKLADDDWIKGDKNSKNVIIEYSDFECPACAAYSSIIDEALKEFGNHVVFAYRHFPLKIHKNAVPGAWAAEAAGIQGKFWEMHDKLFTYQNTWKDQENPEETFDKFARDLGLDVEKFRSDYNSGKVHDAVDADAESAKKNNLTYTPTIFINGKMIDNPRTYDGLRTLIREALQSNP